MEPFDGVTDYIDIDVLYCPRCGKLSMRLNKIVDEGTGGGYALYKCDGCGTELRVNLRVNLCVRIWNKPLTPLEAWRLYMYSTGHKPGNSRREVIPP